MTDSRDATKQARGFSYQRQYGIYFFLKSYGTEPIEIIEEGKINKLTYEDITLIDKNNELDTYQIKFHTGKMNFNRSNDDLFKTIRNKNNLNPKVKNIYFIVSRHQNTFDEFFNKWKDNNLSGQEIYNAIMNLNINDTSAVKIYRDCVKFLKANKNDKINYLSKFIIQEGFTYNELIININNIITDIFKVNDPILILYIRFHIFDLFDKNWFGQNKPLKINAICNELKFIVKNATTNEDNLSLFNDIFNGIIKQIKLFLKLNNNIDNLLKELHNFITQLNNNFEIKHYLCFLILLYHIYDKNPHTEITKLYNIIIKYLCRSLIKSVKTIDSLTDIQIDHIISSVSYYNKHKITKLISISKSRLSFLLSTNDKLFIDNTVKLMPSK